MRTDLSYWTGSFGYLVSLLPFGKPTRLATRHMREFPCRLISVIRIGLKGHPRSSETIQQKRFTAAFADALSARLQVDINKNMVEDLREAYRAAELQKGS